MRHRVFMSVVRLKSPILWGRQSVGRENFLLLISATLPVQKIDLWASLTKLSRHCTQMGYLRRTKQSTPLPSPPLHSRLGCLQFSTGSSKSGTPFHGGDGESFIFSFLSWQTVREALKDNVSQLILTPNWKGPFYLHEFWNLHQVEY